MVSWSCCDLGHLEARVGSQLPSSTPSVTSLYSSRLTNLSPLYGVGKGPSKPCAKTWRDTQELLTIMDIFGGVSLMGTPWGGPAAGQMVLEGQTLSAFLKERER